MVELNIQADPTAGIFRVYVDGVETAPDEIRITALPGKKTKISLVTAKEKPAEYFVNELYLNARTRLRSDDLRRGKP